MKETKYKGYYVTEDGQVWSEKSHKFLSQSMRGLYLRVNLYIDGETKTVPVHRLVAETFIPNPNNLPCVNHIDENKLNNSVENLEWVTVLQNANHGTRNQRISEINKEIFKDTEIKRGKHPEAIKIIMCDPITLQEIQVFDSIGDACDFLNKNYSSAQPNISAVLNGRKKTAYKYFWKKLEKTIDN